jgi:hypothetical protein
MICSEDKLDSAINTGCSTPFGMEHNGYLTLRSGIVGKSITDLVATFTPSESVIPVYQPAQDTAYKPKSDGEKNAYGLIKFAKTIEVFLIPNTELSQNQIMQLKDDEWVFVGKQIDGQYIVFGLERGLRLKTTSQELSSTETHGGILLTFDENMVNYPMLFTDKATFNWIDYEVITTLTIGNGQITPKKVYLKVDSNKTCYGVLPNGMLLTSTSGAIDYDYTGVAGAVKLVVPKDSVNFIMYDGTTTAAAAFVGEINLLGNYGYVDTRGCFGITYLLAHNALIMLANNCDLSALSVANQLLAFKENNPTYAGTAVFSNNTDANSANVNAELVLKGTTLNDVVATELVTWTIAIDGY